MLKPKSNALRVVETTLGKITEVKKPVPLQKEGLHVITKTRSDANLMYMFKGKQKPGRGRKKLYDGKINTAKIDKRRLTCFYADEEMKVYGGKVYCVLLKQTVLAAFI